MADYHIEAPAGSKQLIITQHFHAPRHEVFSALTDPLRIPEFWGPERLITRVEKMAAMPGGTWRFVQKDTEGHEYGFHGEYHEVITPEKLVYTSEYEGMPGHVSMNTEELSDEDGQTLLTAHITFQSVEDRDQMLQMGMEEGISEMTRRLNQLLGRESLEKTMATSMDLYDDKGECITINRTFNSPIEKVWERWTDANQYMCWWGPKDFTSPYAKFDLRPGGKYLSCMRGPDGKEYWDTGTFEEIEPLKRIVYTDNFADADGNIVPPSYYGMPGDQPVDMAVQVSLERVDGKTVMTLEHCGFPPGEMGTQAKDGWNQSFDKLEECLG